MRSALINIALFIAAALSVSGCSASRHSAQKTLSFSPAPCVVVPGLSDTVIVDMDINVPSRYVSKRSRAVFVPVILKDTVVLAGMSPVAVDAPIYSEKLERKRKLENYEDPYTGAVRKLRRMRDTLLINYADTVSVPVDSMDQTRFKLLVTSDGCGVCGALDTVDFGGISDPLALLDFELKVKEIEPKFVVKTKIREGRGEADLMFGINSSEIDMERGNNRSEMLGMLNAVQNILSDSLTTVSSVSIIGSASADGPLSLNARLAESRANSAKNWLLSNLDGLTREQRRLFSTGFKPEGWGPVLAAMILASDADTSSVQDILRDYAGENDDVQERYIRALPIWNKIKEHYLSSTRKVEFVYNYSVRSFTTDEEMLEMYATRPDAFNEEEMLRVSQLQPDSSEKERVYRNVLAYFPDSYTAANNLALMLFSRGDTLAASEVMAGINDTVPVAMNTKAAMMAYEDDFAEADSLLSLYQELPEARYNLGMVKAVCRQYEQADSLLRPFADVNSAIVCICLGLYAEAGGIMEASEDMSPEAEYVRTLVAAHDNDADAFFNHLQAAVADSVLKKRAETDVMLDRYRSDVRFSVIMEEQ
ncbi:MAG TPA: hypothetical protein IAC04_03080 [Candidatus Coprenecus stercoravium]|uniref:DUF3868 domain-containing protein n=1 Tax=Candidatus Coprenecus stercoravium TaxID=2840735 RepID=A0A9D2GQL5_9BACT|nr:hypothetical protein [Candidatus Coprenecus stercoravium]